MKNFASTRIVFPVRRLPWYRLNRGLIAFVLLAISITTFIIWCAAKVVR
jgi:hypothetical protein